MNNLAVLLTVHNRKETTLKCLQCLSKQMPIIDWDIDIYLTDDGCTDGTPEAIRKIYPKVNIIKGDGNLYWNRGMIKAWQEAVNNKEYSAYLWLNDDTILMEKSLSKILNPHCSVPDAILVGSCKSSDSKRITFGGSLDFESSSTRIIPNGKLQKCGIFNGNIVLVPQSVYETLGTLDQTYTHSLGDSDYGLSAIRNGIDIFVCEEVLGICDENRSISKWRNKSYSLIERYKNLNSPLGYAPPKEYFHFKRKHWGYLIAIGSIIKIYKNLLFPDS